MKIELLVVAPFFLSACVTPAPEIPTAPEAPAALCLELHHQILFENSGEQQVFEGTMIQAGDRFLVRAFAGPGIDLFTVVRTPTTATQQAHLPGLAERVDMASVGDDIGRVYRSGCAGPPSSTTSCLSGGETLRETKDQQGALLRREYPEAHGTGLTILYEEPQAMCGATLPRRITLAWGKGERRMVILTSGCQERASIPAELTR